MIPSSRSPEGSCSKTPAPPRSSCNVRVRFREPYVTGHGGARAARQPGWRVLPRDQAHWGSRANRGGGRRRLPDLERTSLRTAVAPGRSSRRSSRTTGRTRWMPSASQRWQPHTQRASGHPGAVSARQPAPAAAAEAPLERPWRFCRGYTSPCARAARVAWSSPDQPAGVAGRAGPSSRDRNVSTAPTSVVTIIQCEYRKSFDGTATNSPSS
jgi:hypothetical protein